MGQQLAGCCEQLLVQLCIWGALHCNPWQVVDKTKFSTEAQLLVRRTPTKELAAAVCLYVHYSVPVCISSQIRGAGSGRVHGRRLSGAHDGTCSHLLCALSV